MKRMKSYDYKGHKVTFDHDFEGPREGFAISEKPDPSGDESKYIFCYVCGKSQELIVSDLHHKIDSIESIIAAGNWPDNYDSNDRTTYPVLFQREGIDTEQSFPDRLLEQVEKNERDLQEIEKGSE